MNGLSLFCNVGIGELYLKECGINIVVANELLKDRCDFYKHVYPNCDVIQGDIYKHYDEILEKAKKANCKFLIATPPCQGMSVAGKRDKNDARNQLIIPVLDMIKDLDPDYVIIENVLQILNIVFEYNGNKGHINEILEKEFSGKYHINKKYTLNAQDYGIPQNRKRAIFLLSKNEQWEYPEKDDKLVTVRDTIGDLPGVEAIVDGDKNYFKDNYKKIQECEKVHKWHTPKNHTERHVIAMMHTPTGHSAFENEVYYPKKQNGEKVSGYNTTYKRMEWDKPAPTITMANGSLSSQCNVHPGTKKADGTYSDARVLTVYEIMRLFTIPDDWDIPTWASENLIRKVIGEGVPPLLIKKIVQKIGVKHA